MKTTITKAELHAGLETIKAVADAVRELKRVPSGTLYATVMGHLSLSGYDKIVQILCNAGVIRKHPDHTLEWIAN